MLILVFLVRVGPKYRPFKDYIARTWVGKKLKGNQYSNPLYRHDLWNCYSATILGLPRTNNSTEAGHHAFQTSVDEKHPSVRFVFCLQKKVYLVS